MELNAVGLGTACLSGLRDSVLPKLKHALVFCDNKMAEVLHWTGGMSTLLTAGAEDVREFSSFESGVESQKKAVFLLSTPLEGVTKRTLQDILTQSHFQYVVVFTSSHPMLHDGISLADFDNGTAFDVLEEQILEWMGNMNYTAEVRHVSLFAIQVCPGFFITPTFANLFPLLTSDLQQINYLRSLNKPKEGKACDNLNELDISQLPEDLELELRSLSTSLHGLFQSMGVKEDIYSVGSLSRIVATDLDNFPPAKARRKTCQSRLSLVLVDRTLDLASAMTLQTESLLDRVINTLPVLPGHLVDRRVDLSPLVQGFRSSNPSDDIVLPGCLAPSKITESPDHLTSSIVKKQKEALMDINRKLVETAANEKLPLDLSKRPSRVTAEQLDSTLNLFKGKYLLLSKHLETLQVAMATSQTLKQQQTSQSQSFRCHDNLVAKEKALVQALADSEGREDNQEEEALSEGEDSSLGGGGGSRNVPNAFSMISRWLAMEMEKNIDERELTLDDFVHLLVFVYSLSDGSSENQDDIHSLQEQLVEAIKQDKTDLPPLIQSIVGEKVTEGILPDLVESLWDKLDALMDARRDLKELGVLVDPGSGLSPACVKPLLTRLMEKVVDPTKPEMVDVECKSGGLKDLLKSGFGFFKSSAKPRPGDAPLLMVFVLGGVTASEVKQVKDAVASAKPGFEVIVGGTRICSVESSLHSLLVNDNVSLHHDGR